MVIHNRKSIRLKGYDYCSTGMYFITICTQDRECIFGNIKNGIFTPNQAGVMIERYWLQIEREFKNIKLDEFVIMPNHFHGIIYILDPVMRADTRPAPTIINTVERIMPTTIGDLVCAFKSRTTNNYIQNVKQNNWNPFNKRLWQRNYYEHIIRNETELNKIRDYIKNNPLKWEFDNNNQINEIR